MAESTVSITATEVAVRCGAHVVHVRNEDPHGLSVSARDQQGQPLTLCWLLFDGCAKAHVGTMDSAIDTARAMVRERAATDTPSFV